MKRYFILGLLIFNASLPGQNNPEEKISLNWEKSQRPFAVYIDPFLPMNLDSAAVAHPIRDSLDKHGFRFFHFNEKKDLPKEFVPICRSSAAAMVAMKTPSRKPASSADAAAAPPTSTGATAAGNVAGRIAATQTAAVTI